MLCQCQILTTFNCWSEPALMAACLTQINNLKGGREGAGDGQTKRGWDSLSIKYAVWAMQCIAIKQSNILHLFNHE